MCVDVVSDLCRCANAVLSSRRRRCCAMFRSRLARSFVIIRQGRERQKSDESSDRGVVVIPYHNTHLVGFDLSLLIL